MPCVYVSLLSQSLVAREQVKEELVSMKRRMEEHVQEMTLKLTQERELTRKETGKERDALHAKVE